MSIFRTAAPPFPIRTLRAEEYDIPLLRPEKWLQETSDGELAVDVYETSDCFVVQATLAGVSPDRLTLSVHRDLLTIRGERPQCAPHAERQYLTQECYWGKFSRSLLLPEAVDVVRAHATLTLGVLTITLPKLVERTDITVNATEESYASDH